MLPISLLMEENGNMETKIIDQLKADTIETIEEKIALIKNERLASISQGQLDLLPEASVIGIAYENNSSNINRRNLLSRHILYV